MPDRRWRPDDPGRVQVAAIVSAFRPDHGLLRVCRSALPQVDLLVVVDDGSPAVSPVLAKCRDLGALVVQHDTNRGIGAALNTGVERALDALRPTAPDRLVVLTLDQDSELPTGYVDALLDAAQAAAARGAHVGLVGPQTVEGIGSMVAAEEHGVLLGGEPIQSGLLVPADVLDVTGPFAAELFIDGVDTELYLRTRAHGLRTVVAPGVHLGHRLGSAHRVAGGRLTLTYAAPFRYYYIARNRIFLVRRYARTEPRWCLTAVGRDVRHLAVTTVLVPGRRARWAATLAGVRDALRGVTGPRPAR